MLVFESAYVTLSAKYSWVSYQILKSTFTSKSSAPAMSGAFLPKDMGANLFSALSAPTGPAGPPSLRTFRLGASSPQTLPIRASPSRGGGSGATSNSSQKGSAENRIEESASAGVAVGGVLGAPIPFSGRAGPPHFGDTGLDALGGSFGGMSLATGPRVQPLVTPGSRVGNGPSAVSVPSAPQERLVLSMAGRAPLRGPSDPSSVRGREDPSMLLFPRGVPRPVKVFGGVGGGVGLMLETGAARGPGRQRGMGGPPMKVSSAKGYPDAQDMYMRKPAVLNQQSGANPGRQGFKYKPLGTTQRAVQDDAFGHFQASGSYNSVRSRLCQLDVKAVACAEDVAMPCLTHPCSLPGATTPAFPHEFQGKSSTRMVSKFHLGRRGSPNMSRRSFQAEAAVEELKSVPGMSTPQGQAQFALCMDQFWQSSGAAMEDAVFMVKELGNQGEWHKSLALFHWLVDKQEVRLQLQLQQQLQQQQQQQLQ